MFAKIRLQLHSTVHVSGVKKYLPFRSADFFRFTESFHSAALNLSIASHCHPKFPITNLSYRFPIFKTITYRTTSQTTSKNNKKTQERLSAHPPTEPHKKLKPTQKHNNNPSHLHLK